MSKNIHIFADAPDPEALAQFHSAMQQKFAVAGALLPDAHVGYSLPIGGVVATRGVILPAWVGYDIGCGVCALPSSFLRQDIEKHRQEIFQEIYRTIPMGQHGNKEHSITRWNINAIPHTPALDKLYQQRKGKSQMGSLGGGNHFIEIGHDEDQKIWIVIHSGSRGTGHGVAGHYMKKAARSQKAKEGHYGFSVDSEEGREYITDMNFCLHYALANRQEMARRVGAAINLFCHGQLLFEQLINRNHNHAECKDGLWIHRKGATHAERDMLGVIPGNMRDGSFIVAGLGNPKSLYSSSHGAGRKLSRTEAQRSLDSRSFSAEIEAAGVLAKTKGNLDESPAAYKDIFSVMKQQTQMCRVLHHIQPIINIKA